MPIKSASDLRVDEPGEGLPANIRRWLYENFAILRDLLSPGITTNFITVDQKLLVVVNGVVADIQVSYNGLTDNMLFENGDRMLFENGDAMLFELTVP